MALSSPASEEGVERTWKSASKDSQEDAGTSDADSDDSASEDSSEYEILPGNHITTTFGAGYVEDFRTFQGINYVVIGLNGGGSVNAPYATAKAWLRKDSLRNASQSNVKGTKIPNQTGHIRMYNPAKGWGFIQCDLYPGDIFLHSKHMIGNSPGQYIGHFQSVQEGHVVKFDLDLCRRDRPQALNVRVIQVTDQEINVVPKRKAKRAGLEDPELDEGSLADEAASQSQFTMQASRPEFVPGAPSYRRRGTLRMRGLPFSATAQDVVDFFKGFGVRAEDVTLMKRADGSPSGEAVVQFAREELAQNAMRERNMDHMKNRYIELFPAKPNGGWAKPKEGKGGATVLSLGQALPAATTPAPLAVPPDPERARELALMAQAYLDQYAATANGPGGSAVPEQDQATYDAEYEFFHGFFSAQQEAGHFEEPYHEDGWQAGWHGAEEWHGYGDYAGHGGWGVDAYAEPVGYPTEAPAEPWRAHAPHLQQDPDAYVDHGMPAYSDEHAPEAQEAYAEHGMPAYLHENAPEDQEDVVQRNFNSV